MIGSGESGIRPMDRALYYDDCYPEWYSSFLCNHFNVPEPNAIEHDIHTRHKFRGTYDPRNNAIRYSAPMLGLVLHELAHHVVHMRNCMNGGSRRLYHDRMFCKVLQEMHDIVGGTG